LAEFVAIGLRSSDGHIQWWIQEACHPFLQYTCACRLLLESSMFIIAQIGVDYGGGGDEGTHGDRRSSLSLTTSLVSFRNSS
jgi:hypothetical protein